MDNRVFNVNGAGTKLLAAVLEAALNQETYGIDEKFGKNKFTGYRVDPEYGLVMYRHAADPDRMRRLGMSQEYVDRETATQNFLAPMTAEQVAPLVEVWLEQNKEMKFAKGRVYWDEDADHDGSNEFGWRVYVGDWGHIGSEHMAVCAVVPAYMWYGK